MVMVVRGKLWHLTRRDSQGIPRTKVYSNEKAALFYPSIPLDPPHALRLSALSISIDLHNITVGRDDAIWQDRSMFLHIIDGVSNEITTEERNEKQQEHYCIYRMSVQCGRSDGAGMAHVRDKKDVANAGYGLDGLDGLDLHEI